MKRRTVKINHRMKNLLKVACIGALLILASCSPKSKSNAIWFKVSDEGHEQFNDYKKEGEWYVIKLAKEDVKEGYVLTSKSTKGLVKEYITEIRLSSNVTAISVGAFEGFYNLERIDIPSSVQTIKFWAFRDCDNLREINIPSSVHTIGADAFSDCDNLRNVDIPSSVHTIDMYAFEDCDNLREITIPSSVQTIGERAFYHCDNLREITIPSSVQTIGEGAFANCPYLKIKRFSAYDGSWHEEYADNSWIVGTWSCNTPYGTMTLKFEGDGSSGSCAELTYGSYNYGRYTVKDGVLRYKLNGESITNVIEIHDGHRLYCGGGYYLHKN